MAKKTIPQNDPASQTPQPGDSDFNPHGVALPPAFAIGDMVRVKAGYDASVNEPGTFRPIHLDGSNLTIKEYGMWGTTVLYYGFEELEFLIEECWLDLGRAALRAADAGSHDVPCPVCGGKGFFDTFDERTTTHSTEDCSGCHGSQLVSLARAKELKDAMYPFDAGSSDAPKDGGR